MENESVQTILPLNEGQGTESRPVHAVALLEEEIRLIEEQPRSVNFYVAARIDESRGDQTSQLRWQQARMEHNY